ncbi:hypothetical protein L249_8000 [Ophiocordyceps polyrhachis-furcata BCC 54312]|uniref:Large ribosomal subunit protein mL67 n=1 Tax=Ophiocordyceps polyrhachis-furcata BCC 54312 TaxID=1330021 RepID=A0A367LHF0_9HYPO|nr:hypothetical protein L249_8000 [Ophiocordyceps polyrhachis-furcata BCC 54312]
MNIALEARSRLFFNLALRRPQAFVRASSTDAAPLSERQRRKAKHGEEVWVFACRKTRQVVFSFERKLSRHHVNKQLPFVGKKSKPENMRKDLWSPFLRITVPEGLGHVGRAIFKQLREFKHLHEVSWDGDLIFKTPSEYTEEERRRMKQYPRGPKPQRPRKQRAASINDMVGNVVADLATILAGTPKGGAMTITQLKMTPDRHANAIGKAQLNLRQVENKVKARLHKKAKELVHEEDELGGLTTDSETTAEKTVTAYAKLIHDAKLAIPEEAIFQLCPVTVSWVDEQNKEYAEKWSSNVTHEALELNLCRDVERLSHGPEIKDEASVEAEIKAEAAS